MFNVCFESRALFEICSIAVVFLFFAVWFVVEAGMMLNKACFTYFSSEIYTSHSIHHLYFLRIMLITLSVIFSAFYDL